MEHIQQNQTTPLLDLRVTGEIRTVAYDGTYPDPVCPVKIHIPITSQTTRIY